MRHQTKWRAALVLSLLMAITAVPGQALAVEPLDDLAGPWHLFVDDFPVAAKSDLVRTYHPFQKYAANPVLVPDQPWEGTAIYVYGTVLPEESGTGYRMWYHCLPGSGDDKYRLLYATSPDGIHWNKPNLGIVAWNSSVNNNIYIRRSGQDHIASVIHTPWEADPARRYKLVNFDGAVGQFMGAWSGDGIHWTDVPSNPIIPPASDVGNYNWDAHVGRYIGYMKVPAYVNGLKRRAVGFTSTTNFLAWPAASLIMAPDAYDDRWVPAGTIQRTHFYGLCGFAYESGYIGLLWIFRATDADGYYTGPVFTEIVSSRDGVNWVRQEGARPAILPNGPSGTWDSGQIYTVTHPVVEGDTIKLYYGGSSALHGQAGNVAIGLATLRKDGFASLDAGGTTGSITTKEIYGAAGPLRVNFSGTSGWLKVEVLDADGNVLPGYSQADCVPLTGDAVDQVVTWATHTNLPNGVDRIRLRFLLQNASIYSFMAGESAILVEPATILQHPGPQNVCPGGVASLSVAVAGEGPLAYQWQKDGADLPATDRYIGVTTPTLMIWSADVSDAGTYRCRITSLAGETYSSAAALTLRPASFTGVGILSGGTSSSADGVTADGSVVCGTSANRAFIWTSTNGMRSLGVPAGASSSTAAGVGVYNDNVVVAADTNLSSRRAQRWDGDTTGVGVYTDLPRASSNREWIVRSLGTDGATDIWIAGSTLAGGDGGGREAVRYQQSANSTATVALPSYPSGAHDHSDFWAASDNGAFAGQVQFSGTAPSGGSRQAWSYSAATASVMLNTLLGAPASTNAAVARAISRNALVCAGGSYYSGGVTRLQPTIWFSPATATAIPFVAGGDNDNYGEILALSGKGTLAGGYSYNQTSGGPREALIWDAVNGTRQLQSVLTAQYGLDLAGWSLQEVRAISADGVVLAGVGLHNGYTEGWVATLGYTPSAPPTIIQQPQAQSVCPAAAAAFSVVASPDTQAYLWQKNGVTLSDDGHYSGTTTRTLTISSVDDDDIAPYRCLVAGRCDIVSSSDAALTMKARTAITQHPTAQSTLPRRTVVFTAAATGEGELTYRWQKDAADLSDGGHYSGTSTPTLTVSNVDAADVGNYRCVASGCDSVASNSAALTLIPTVPADLDIDGDVDISDFSIFQYCFSGPNQPMRNPLCAAADFDGDTDADLADFGRFQACFNGPNRPPGQACQ